MHQRVSTAALLTLALATPAAAQQTIIVSGGGTALQAAIDQASPGDILVVRAAQYSQVSVSKGIAILCDPDVGIFVGFIGTPAVTISNLPAGQHFRMRGGRVLANGFNQINARINDNAGSVLIEDTFLSSSIAVLTRVQRNTQVAFNRCTLGRVEVSDSNAAFSGCTARGNCIVSDGSPNDCSAIGATRSRVSISGGEVYGQNALIVFPPSPAIQLTDSVLTIAGDASTVIASGTGSPATPAILSLSSGAIVLDPNVQVLASANAPIQGPATLRVRATPSVTAQGTPSGQVFTARTFGAPGSAVVLLADAPRTPVVTPFGDLWLGVTGLIVDAGTMPPSGVRVRSFALPPLSPAEPTILQPVALLPDGELVVGTPTGIVQN